MKLLREKKIILIVIILVLIGIYFGFIYDFPKRDFPNEMRGRIIEIKNESIVVEGPVGKEHKTIEFIITPETVLINIVMAITSDQLKSGGTFTPKIEKRPGLVSDLTIETGINLIRSKENLSKTRKVTATEIIYRTYDFPQVSVE